MTLFKDYALSPKIIRALDDLNLIIPTDVQHETLPHLLNHQDVLVKSQTGSGKTAAFLIPVIEHLEWEEKKPQSLILAPTRELAHQIAEEASLIGRHKRIKAIEIVGKQPFKKQKVALSQKQHIIVATPGRLLDHIQKETIDLSAINCLIIDEADRLFDMGFFDQVYDILEHIPKTRVTGLFSATLSHEINELASAHMKEPTQIEMTPDTLVADRVDHFLVSVDEKDRTEQLINTLIVENPTSALVFCQTKRRVDQVYTELKREGYPVGKIHGDLTQEERFSIMDQFKNHQVRYLIATDVAARGIDVDELSLIVNLDIPEEVASYVHRIGRTGRKDQKGRAITFVSEKDRGQIAQIEVYISQSIEQRRLPSEKEVNKHRAAHMEKLNQSVDTQPDRTEKMDASITKLYFNGGKQKKLRAGDFVGAITSIPSVSADDIGVISIMDRHTFVDILNDKGDHVMEAMKSIPVKGKQLKVYVAND
ncbi:ATP-dependent RNA helicase DbpA [Pelagirhabdus alkalitolerans]|uniref:ATP-dependent RNA helicase DbpA n=1 Tax=Pelagirhabdus alkalitolerans TaxID=1612202 RepID=A0A1G6L1I6_9BACI|nr:DEAD/DEAH box helicase [Pelagirhabdus alkalitolerans]SDC37063.1 ATP-dependent RNA helicase DbpA [Pelagirhabdus alkalitolerans]